jgi:hypothetical protein
VLVVELFQGGVGHFRSGDARGGRICLPEDPVRVGGQGQGFRGTAMGSGWWAGGSRWIDTILEAIPFTIVNRMARVSCQGTWLVSHGFLVRP